MANGTTVRMTVQRSADDPRFLYVQRLTVTDRPHRKGLISPRAYLSVKRSHAHRRRRHRLIHLDVHHVPRYRAGEGVPRPGPDRAAPVGAAEPGGPLEDPGQRGHLHPLGKGRGCPAWSAASDGRELFAYARSAGEPDAG